MPGLLSSSLTFTICEVDDKKILDATGLRKGAFSDVPDPDGFRFGWTGLGSLLDTDNFFLATCDNRFAGFSYRLDARKPSGAVVRLHLAEKIREEELKGNKPGAKRRKEMREEIVARLTASAEYVPTLIDCLWDNEQGRLVVGSVSEKMLERVLAHFKGCFGMDAIPMSSELDMGEVFAMLQKNNGLESGGWFLQPMGSASLKTMENSAEASAIAVQNNLDAVSDALGHGLSINKISLVATDRNNEEKQLYFGLSDILTVTNLRLPKAEKDAEEDATFLINANICSDTADIVKSLATA